MKQKRMRRNTDMARTSSLTTVETKIAKAQDSVMKAKKKYDNALAELEKLLDKRDALRRDELVNAIMKSSRTYEEIIRFINTNQ